MVGTDQDIDLNAALDEYTKSLNPLCRRIVTEKQNLASLYGSQWKEFTADDRDLYIDEHFIPKNVQDKYKRLTGASPDEIGAESFPRLKIKPGQRIIEDQEGDMWQDEHSGPFSWETGSQGEIEFDAPVDTKTNRKSDPKRPKSPRLVRAPSLPDGTKGALDGSEQSNFHTVRSLWEAHHLPTGEFYIAPLITPQSSRATSIIEEQEKTTSDKIPSQAGLKSINLTDEVKFQERTLETIADVSAAEEAKQAVVEPSTKPKSDPISSKSISTTTPHSAEPESNTRYSLTASSNSSTKELRMASGDAVDIPLNGAKATSNNTNATPTISNVTSVKSKAPSVKVNVTSARSNVASSSVAVDKENELLRARPVIINTDDIELKITEDSDRVENTDHQRADTSFTTQTSATRSSGSAPIAEPEEDILAKFGVTFSHGLKSTSKPESTNQETESGATRQSEEKSGGLDDVMSFLADW